jgi:hypothetical protein
VAKRILIGLGVVVGLLIGVVAVLAMIAPTELHVEREVIIDKPKDVVFEQLKLVKNHESWSPWFKRDPNIVKEYRGTDGTVGFVSSWSGNDEVGVGEQEITKIAEGERIDYELRFKKPMEDTSTAYLVTEEAGNGQTKVRWGMEGKLRFPGNVICMLMNMKGMLISDFDEGLADLKKHLESEPDSQEEPERDPTGS